MTERATDLFLALTPERVLDAVEEAGLHCHPICYPLNSYENRVYEVELEDRTRVVAKFYRPGRWTESAILEEHRFLDQLATEEIPVCPMRSFPDGRSLHRIDGIWYCVADRRGGRAPDELDVGMARRLGMLVGRLHLVGARHPAPERPRLTADHYVRRHLRWLREHQVLPPRLQRRYGAAADTIANAADELMADIETHRIHADLHLGNVLERDGVLRLLDFDDMVTGPAVQDLWLALPGRDDETLALREIFIEGYEQFRSFDRSSLRLVEPLRGLRLVRYATWLARRWHDPAFKLGWPQFGSEDYWDEQTKDLESLVAVIESESRAAGDPPTTTSGTSTPSEELLPNKDYFWDWEG